MLHLARRQLRRILVHLRHDIRAGTPLVVLEPSCAATFRDELVNLLPDDPLAKRLARQTFTFAEFVTGELDGHWLPRLGGSAVVHAHCHHKALFGQDDLRGLMDRLGIEAQVLEAGCCGVAGGFGYEAGQPYEVSMKAGESVLLPAVREAPEDALIIADGFSCRCQIGAATARRALHPAQAVQMALEDAPLAARRPPETGRFEARPTRLGARDVAVLAAGTALVAGALTWGLRRSTLSSSRRGRS